MEPGFDQKTWLEYVTKLNDREIRNKSANGLTVWALVGVIGVLMFKIIDKFDVIFENSNSLSISAIFLAIALIVCIILNFSIKAITPIDSSRTIITDIDGQRLTISNYTVGLLVILLIVFNYYAAIVSYQGQLSQWPFYVLSIYYFINLLSLVVFNFMRRNVKLKFEPHSGLRENRIVILGNWLILLLMTLISIHEVLIQNLVLSNISLLKLALELTAILICLLLLSFKYIRSLKYAWLEVFERKIIIDDLSVEQIRTKLTEGFLGKQTLDWLSGIQNEILKNNNEIKNMFQEFRNDFLEFKNESLTIEEIKEILDFNRQLITKIVDQQLVYSNYIELKAKEINNFSIQGLLSKEEKGYIQSITDQWYTKKLNNEKFIADIRSKMDNQKRYLAICDEKLLQENEKLHQEIEQIRPVK
jgi:hypothetical protein